VRLRNPPSLSSHNPAFPPSRGPVLQKCASSNWLPVPRVDRLRSGLSMGCAVESRIVRVGENSIAFYYEPSSFATRVVRDTTGGATATDLDAPESSHTVPYDRAAVYRVAALYWTQNCPRCPVVAWKKCAERSC
jgi:hypothetical protein